MELEGTFTTPQVDDELVLQRFTLQKMAVPPDSPT